MPWRSAVPDPTISQQFGIVIGAIATLISAIGGLAIFQGIRERRAGTGPSQDVQITGAIDRQTEVLERHCARAEQLHGEHMAVMRSIQLSLVRIEARDGRDR